MNEEQAQMVKAAWNAAARREMMEWCRENDDERTT